MKIVNDKSKKYKEQDLRRGIDYIGVCVIFYCHDGKGNLLLHKRSKNCRDEVGRWDVGGGAVEFGEDFEKSVVREIMEEYSTRPKKVKFLRPLNALRQENGVKTHWLALVYVAELNPQEVSIGDPEKMEELGWFGKDSLPKPLHSQFEPFLQFAKNEIFG